jgi:hypothetical protein
MVVASALLGSVSTYARPDRVAKNEMHVRIKGRERCLEHDATHLNGTTQFDLGVAERQRIPTMQRGIDFGLGPVPLRMTETGRPDGAAKI